jgi:hypothetical protein
VFDLLEEQVSETSLVNARDVKHLPGPPKTDRLDAVWFAGSPSVRCCGRVSVPPPAVRRLRLGTVHAHLLRHTLATELLGTRASLDEVGQLLRHRSRASTAIYAKVDQHRLAVE